MSTYRRSISSGKTINVGATTSAPTGSQSNPSGKGPVRVTKPPFGESHDEMPKIPDKSKPPPSDITALPFRVTKLPFGESHDEMPKIPDSSAGPPSDATMYREQSTPVQRDTDDYAVIGVQPAYTKNDEYDPNEPWNARAEQNKRDPMSEKDLEVGTEEWKRRQREHWTFGNAQDLGDAMQYGEEGIYQLGGYGSMPLPQRAARGRMGGQGVGKGTGYRYTLGGGKAQPGIKYSRYTYTGSGRGKTGLLTGRRGGSERLMIGADISGKIRHGDFTPNEVFDDGGLQFTQRKLGGLDMVSTILKGGDLEGMPGAGQTSKQRPENVFTGAVKGVGGIGSAVKSFFSLSDERDVNKVTRYMAMTEFTKFADKVRAIPNIKHLESDRYYNVFYDPAGGVTYIEWKPTEDISNILRRSTFGSTLREWSEDAVSALGMRVPAWHNRVRYVRRKYGDEGPTVKHYGYSRGGGLATHFGGTGYGTGYFSSFPPSISSKSKLSGDKIHDVIINPLSYGLLLRNTLKGSF